MSGDASRSHPVLFGYLSDLLGNIDHSNSTLERAEFVLELLHFCAEDGHILLEADKEVQEMILRICHEYQETARYYQEIAEKTARMLSLLSQEPKVTAATAATQMTYDPNAHHC